MKISFTKLSQRLDTVSGIAYGLALIVPLTLYLSFYATGISQGVASDVLPAGGVIWLKIHIAAYGIAYSLYFMGLVLAAIYFLMKSSTRLPWIESATAIATILSIVGLITGVLYAVPAWNAWWVWDAKHVIVLVNTLILLVITPFIVLIRLFLKLPNQNLLLVLLLFVAVGLCMVSWLSGFLRVVHPQWFPDIFFR